MNGRALGHCGRELNCRKDIRRTIVICPKCGEDNAPTFRFCGMCGTLLEARLEARRPAGAPVPDLRRPLGAENVTKPANKPVPPIAGPSMLGLNHPGTNPPSAASPARINRHGLAGGKCFLGLGFLFRARATEDRRDGESCCWWCCLPRWAEQVGGRTQIISARRRAENRQPRLRVRARLRPNRCRPNRQPRLRLQHRLRARRRRRFRAGSFRQGCFGGSPAAESDASTLPERPRHRRKTRGRNKASDSGETRAPPDRGQGFEIAGTAPRLTTGTRPSTKARPISTGGACRKTVTRQ